MNNWAKVSSARAGEYLHSLFLSRCILLEIPIPIPYIIRLLVSKKSKKIEQRGVPTKPSPSFPGRLVEPCLNIVLPVFPEVPIWHHVVVLNHPFRSASAWWSEKEKWEGRRRDGEGNNFSPPLSLLLWACDPTLAVSAHKYVGPDWNYTLGSPHWALSKIVFAFKSKT